MPSIRLVFLMTFLLGILHSSQSYILTVNSQTQECFHDRGQQISLTFEVINGDIELRITDPRGSIVHHGDDRSGKHTFGSADPKETYKYCFINEKSTAVVMFSVDVFNEDGAPVATNQTAEEHAIKNMIRQLEAVLISIKHEQEYMHVREQINQEISESTRRRLNIWSFFEGVVANAVNFFQVWYVRRVFEIRRVV